MVRLLSRVVLGLAALAMLPGHAEAQGETRACRATGYFLFTFNQLGDGEMVTRTARINILQDDMEVVATSPAQTFDSVTNAKRWACAQAAACYVRQAAGVDSCGGSELNIVYETIRKPSPIEDWRRQVACNHARLGSVSGIRHTDRNAVTVVRTKIVATATRDGITRNADYTVDESDHTCWSPSPKPGTQPDPNSPGPDRPRPKPSRTDSDHQPSRTDAAHQPTRTDSSHEPSRTDSSHAPRRTNGPSPIAAVHVTVTPPEQKGKCPASVLMQARLELREPVEVQWWVSGEDGYQSPKYVRNFTTPDASLIWRRHIDPKQTTGGLSQMPGGKPGAAIHRGYFQIHFETAPDRDQPVSLGESDRVPFTVDCSAAPPDRFRRR